MKRLFTALLLVAFCFSCAGSSKFVRNYDKFMEESDKVVVVLCKYSERSSCFWKAALGGDIGKLPHEAVVILERIEGIVKGKKPEDLTECEKGEVAGLWARFTFLIGKEALEKLPADLARLAAMF